MCGMFIGLNVDMGQTESMLGCSIWGHDSSPHASYVVQKVWDNQLCVSPDRRGELM